jgi:putative oxidoreductase
MLVAMFKVHLAAGFSFMNIKGMGPDGPIYGLPGYEVNLLYIAALLSLILLGPGVLSIDQWRGHRTRRYHEYLRK